MKINIVKFDFDKIIRLSTMGKGEMILTLSPSFDLDADSVYFEVLVKVKLKVKVLRLG